MKKFMGFILVLAFICACTFMFTISLAVVSDTVGDINFDGSVVAGGERVVRSGDAINEDMVVLGGKLAMEKDSQLNGDLAVFGGAVEIDGTVNGDVTMTGGNIDVGPHGHVKGDVGIVGGNLNQVETAKIDGDVLTMGGSHSKIKPTDKAPEPAKAEGESEESPKEPPTAPTIPTEEARPSSETEALEQELAELEEEFSKLEEELKHSFDYDNDHEVFVEQYHEHKQSDSFFWSIFTFVGNIIRLIVLMVAVLVISWLVAALLPEQMKTVSDTVVDNTLLSFGVGLGTLVVGFIVGVLLLITICLIPVTLVSWFLMAVAALFGWIAIAQVVGERLLVAMDKPFVNLTTSTMVGVFVLTIISAIPDTLGVLWCIGGLLSLASFVVTFVIIATGLGGAILSRFGTQNYDSNHSPFNSTGNWSSRPRTQWPDPDLDDDPKPEVDLNKKD